MQPFWLRALVAEEYGDWIVIDWYEETFNLYQNPIGCGGKNGIYLCVYKYQRVFLGENTWQIFIDTHERERLCVEALKGISPGQKCIIKLELFQSD